MMHAFQTVHFQLFEYCNEKKLEEVFLCDNLEIQDDLNDLKYNLLKYRTKTLNDGKRLVSHNKEPNNLMAFKSTVGFRCFPNYILNYICRDDQNQALFKHIGIRDFNAVVLGFLYKRCGMKVHDLLQQYLCNKETLDCKIACQMDSFINDVRYDSDINNNELKSFISDILKSLIPTAKKLFDIKTGSSSLKDQFLRVMRFVKFHLLYTVYQELQNMALTIVSITNNSIMIEGSYSDELLNIVTEKCYHSLGVRLEIYEKELLTSWTPTFGTKNIMSEYNIICDQKHGEKYSSKFAHCLLNDTSLDSNADFIQYINKYVFVIDKPHLYGWKNYVDTQDYLWCSKNVLVDKMGKAIVNAWNSSDHKRNYAKIAFDVDLQHSNVLNTYYRPEMTKHDKEMKDFCPITYSYIKDVVCGGNEQLFNFMMSKYLPALLKTGRTELCLVAIGSKGVGKSSFVEILKALVGGDKYYTQLNDISRIKQKHNTFLKEKILISIEEVPENAAFMCSVQNILKDLITSKTLLIEPKGVDAYSINSYCNFVLCTNNSNPALITDDNRRYVIMEFSELHRSDNEYFKRLHDEVNANLTKLRWCFYNKCTGENIAAARPVTAKELELRRLNRSNTDQFIKEHMVLKGSSTDESRLYSEVYEQYKAYCKEEGVTPSSKKLFSRSLNNLGYIVDRRLKGNLYYINLKENLNEFSSEV